MKAASATEPVEFGPTTFLRLPGLQPLPGTARQAHVQQAEADFDALPFDAAAARAFGRVAASLRRAGRKAKPRTYDAMIAAVAVANDLPLYTCNPADFTGIQELRVVVVPHPDSIDET